MDNINYEALNVFVEGLRGDFANHVESSKSYSNSKNGRLYSHNGVISFSSIKGTKEVYKNPFIVKFIGGWAFDDELIIIVKADREKIEQSSGDENDDFEVIDVEKIVSSFLKIEIPAADSSATIDFDQSVKSVIVREIVPTEDQESVIFDIPFSEVENSNDQVDLTEYFQEMINSSNYELCPMTEHSIPEPNILYLDCVYSLKKKPDGTIVDSLLWSGNLNLKMDAKIVTFGIFENNFYKRIYFTDYNNPFRVINIRDPKFSSRKASELSTFQNTALLRAKVESIGNNGQIKAGTVFYTYRLITENGQVTEFAPLSEDAKILFNDNDFGFKGGTIDQVTTKNVLVKCNLLKHRDFKEIECVAIEYQAKGSPTAIRSLGIKMVAPVVYFNHYGNEKEFDSDLTLSDILVRKNVWKYCSDLSSKSNMLIAAGLRNEPLPQSIQNVTHLFSLHSWADDGQTFNSYINPDPIKYKWIDPSTQNKMYTSERKLYNSIQSFESFTITLLNKENGQSISRFIPEKSKQKYEDYIEEIIEWLESVKETPEFSLKFPGVKMETIQRKILFSKTNPGINFDFSKLFFTYSTSQIIEDYQDDVKLINLAVSGTKIHGYQSLGFNQGTGIRITFKTEHNELAQAAVAAYPGSKPLINTKKPSTKKYLMKGELYRLGIQVWLTDGSTPFTIILGDIKIPDIGEFKSYLDASGNPVTNGGGLTSPKYKNSVIENNKLYAEGIYLDVEVCLSCELQKLISMYQIVYVERDEDNRSILCQGISAPLERTNRFYHTEYVNIPDPINTKWNLPYMGGPNYDRQGLMAGDIDINLFNEWDAWSRVVTHRSMFYFDAPDVIFNQVSADKIKNGKVVRINRLNHDMNRYATYTRESEIFPAFSRRIPWQELEGDENARPYWVLFNVMKEREGMLNEIAISHAEKFLPGEIKSSTAFDTPFDVSNNALGLAWPAWYYLDATRADELCNNTSNSGTALHYELMKSAQVGTGNETVMIKTEEPVFSDEFISQTAIKLNANDFIKDVSYGVYPVVDTHALINIKVNNAANIYGGRSEQAYSKNVYYPLSETIPVLKVSNNIQRFKVHGDTYVSLFMRSKTSYSGHVYEVEMENHSSCRDKYELNEWTRHLAWAYGVVIESTVEPRWSSDDMFYNTSGKIDFSKPGTGTVNEAYLQKNDLKSYIPKPYNFKDDPNLSNIVAISDVKLSGNYYDAFSSFKINNFYELEKDKGTAFNLAKYLDTIFVIQEDQTSQLMINENVMITSSAGEVSVKEGDGNRISGHKVISNYGTSIRRAIVEAMSDDQKTGGFTFIDEKRYEWMKSDKPALVERDLQLKFREIFEKDPIVDTEGYYDDEYKETNIRMRTKSGKSFMLSFNEKFTVFNGWMEIESDIFFMWQNGIFAPNIEENSETMHQFNKGSFVKIFNKNKKIVIETTININPQTVKIFKSWSAAININYPIDMIKIKTNLGQERKIFGSHQRYQIHEGTHNVPFKNDDDWDDLRGEWAVVELTISPKKDQKIDIFSFINFVRHSNQ